MDNVLISVIVPVYNTQNEIERCVSSITSQTHSTLEIILVDDGSTDGSTEIIRKLSETDRRIRTIFKENGGVTSARLAGVAAASGEWIGFVDGDDEIEPVMYERLLNNAVSHEAQISHCGYQLVFPEGKIEYYHNTGKLEEMQKGTALQELLKGTIEPSVCNKLFKKELFKVLLIEKRMDSSIKNNEDLLMNFYLFRESSKSVFEDKCSYRYIVREGSASKRKMNEHLIFDPIKVKEIILREASESVLETAKSALVTTCVHIYDMLVLQEGFSQEKKEIRKKLKDYRAYYSSLGVKNRLQANMIVSIPPLYDLIYRAAAVLRNRKVS